MAFSETQALELSAKLSAKNVRTREINGQRLSYIEGWHAIAEANRIFGFDAWDRKTILAKCVWSGMHRGAYVCTYTAKVRVNVRAGKTQITREGCGTGEGKGRTPGDAHDTALKAAETDATKRALATFGNPFGLALYDKELKGVWNAAKLRAVSADTKQKKFAFRPGPDSAARFFEEPEAFSAELENALNHARTIEALFELWEQNIAGVRLLREKTNGSTAAGKCPATDLVAQLRSRAVELAKEDKAASRTEKPSCANGNVPIHPDPGGSSGVDKSALALSEPKRRRSKEHLHYVAKQPCLICGRSPVQAHHLRFAQPRAMARKVSDEYVVPLCNIHHFELHQTGDEKAWWKDKRIDPMDVAWKLWAEQREGKADETSPPELTAGLELPADGT